MPGMGRRYESSHPRLAAVRVWPVKGFRNHLIFYRPIENGIEVVHLFHGARDLDAALTAAIQEGRL
jgi:toxin ParE1/3/4